MHYNWVVERALRPFHMVARLATQNVADGDLELTCRCAEALVRVECYWVPSNPVVCCVFLDYTVCYGTLAQRVRIRSETVGRYHGDLVGLGRCRLNEECRRGNARNVISHSARAVHEGEEVEGLRQNNLVRDVAMDAVVVSPLRRV